jgi:hypothetical protein
MVQKFVVGGGGRGVGGGWCKPILVLSFDQAEQKASFKQFKEFANLIVCSNVWKFANSVTSN